MNTYDKIRQLAAHDQPGALVIAEQAIDNHVAIFETKGSKITALDTLSCDLTRLAKSENKLDNLLRDVQLYIILLKTQMMINNAK